MLRVSIILQAVGLYAAEIPKYPKFPTRAFQILEFGWRFEFYRNEKDLENERPLSTRTNVNLPDAFDLPHLKSRCDSKGKECCNKSWGTRGDESCWGVNTTEILLMEVDDEENEENNFDSCCGEDMLEQRGLGVYTTRLQPGMGLLQFGACLFRCEIYIDNELIDEVVSGYAPFTVKFPKSMESRELRVVVDNRFDAGRAPIHQAKVDWYQAGGLVRHVVAYGGQMVIDRLHVTPRISSTGVVDAETLQYSRAATVDLDIKMNENLSTSSTTAMYEVRVAWVPECTGGVPIGAIKASEGSKVFKNLKLPGNLNDIVWRVEKPQLHHAAVSLYKNDRLVDCVIQRFGVREVSAENGYIFLNGENLQLQGFNRHEMSPDGRGPAMKTLDILQDVRHLKQMGVNFIRGSHYPQDPRFLEFCDEYGILVWEEVMGWQNTEDDFDNPLWMNQTFASSEWMIEASYNHPSVIIRGFLNEGPSFANFSVPVYEAFSNFFKERDGTRLVTWATNAMFEDMNLQHADIISLNTYYGWYPTEEEFSIETMQNIPQMWNLASSWVEANYPDKPFLCSEVGASAIFGRHGGSVGPKWNEEVQSALVQMHVVSMIKNQRLSGFALWDYTDYQTSATWDPIERPRGLNNKGCLSLDRRPKVLYFALRTIFLGDYIGLIFPEKDAKRFDGLLQSLM